VGGIDHIERKGSIAKVEDESSNSRSLCFIVATSGDHGYQSDRQRGDPKTGRSVRGDARRTRKPMVCHSLPPVIKRRGGHEHQPRGDIFPNVGMSLLEA
jgi:hypothetical protein